MNKLLLVFLGYTLTAAVANAQADHPLDARTRQTDSIIFHQVVQPAIGNGSEPDWAVLRTTIVSQYNDAYADRNIIKGKIYYFFGRDWAQFSSAIVQYTQNYEYKDSLSLMNKNAKMILAHSENPADWKVAQGWVKYAADKAPDNPAYKQTYDALTAKLNSR